MIKKGFTLVEMLVVVVVIGILASVILPRVTGSSRESQRKSCTAQIKSINKTIDLATFEQSLSSAGIVGAFPQKGIFSAIGTLPAAVFSSYFVQGGMNCPINNRTYFIDNGRVDRIHGGAGSNTYHVDGANH